MNKQTSTILLGLGVLVLIGGLIAHFAFHGQVFPHFSLVLGAIAVVLLGVGGYGYMSKQA
jgi:hypothetical protein